MAIPDIVEPDGMSEKKHEYTHNKQGRSLKEGYMFVHKSTIWKPWVSKAKYIILTSDCLYCFKRRGNLTSIPCDVMFLKNASIMIEDARKGMRKRFYIKLTSPSLRNTLNLYCFMEEERDEWFTAIMQVLSNLYVNSTNFVHKSSFRSAIFKACSFEDGFLKNAFLRPLEQTKAYSTSCMELTNMSVLPSPDNPSQSPTPIKLTLDACELASKRSGISTKEPCSVMGFDQHMKTTFGSSNFGSRPRSLITASDYPLDLEHTPVVSTQRVKEGRAKAFSMDILNFNFMRSRDGLYVL